MCGSGGGGGIPTYQIDDFHFPALNGFYNVASAEVRLVKASV